MSRVAEGRGLEVQLLIPSMLAGYIRKKAEIEEVVWFLKTCQLPLTGIITSYAIL
jgi:hypothetical protein